MAHDDFRTDDFLSDGPISEFAKHTRQKEAPYMCADCPEPHSCYRIHECMNLTALISAHGAGAPMQNEEPKGGTYAQERAAATAPGPVVADGGGLRFNDGKPRMDLLPPEALFALAELYTVGAKKYAERNWERGMSWSKCFASMMRHAWLWMWGEDRDPETGCSHMTHAAWNALAIVVYASRGIGTDDRPAIRKVAS